MAKAGAIGAAATAFVVLSAAPASAAEVGHGNDYATVYASSPQGPYTISVYDKECDNHRVWVEWVNYNSTVIHSLTDADGCGGRGSERTQRTRVSSFRVCERTKGCSRWVQG